MNHLKTRSVGIIGVGHVGAHVAFSLAEQGVADEIILVECNEAKSRAEQQDLFDAVSYLPHRVVIREGSLADLKNCDVAVISVGILTTTEDRLAELAESLRLVRSIVPELMQSGFDGIIINITNPCDLVAREVWKLSGLPASRVFGTGTMLDSARFRSVLAELTGFDHKSISAFTLGEHGDSQLALWSHVTFGGRPLAELEQEGRVHLDREAVLERVRRAAWVAFAGKQATEYAIAVACTRLISIIFHDEKAVVPISVSLDGRYGEQDLFLSLPCVLGASGVEEVLTPRMAPDEEAAFHRSADVLRRAYSSAK